MENKHKEIGWLLISIMMLSLLILIVGYFTVMNIELTTLIVIAFAISFVTLLFYKLTVKINNDGILLTYGIGLIRIKLNIHQIESVEITRTPWYYGLGIRISPQGLIYNIQSLNAIKINHSKNGKSKTLFIGSPQPELVLKAIEENLTNKDA